MFYTYIIRSIAHPDQRYIGHTADLRQRLAKYNKRRCPTYLQIQTVENRSLYCF